MAKADINIEEGVYTEQGLRNIVERCEDQIKKCHETLLSLVICTPKDLFPEDTYSSILEQFDDTYETLLDNLFEMQRHQIVLDELLYGDGELKQKFQDALDELENLAKESRNRSKNMEKLGLSSYNFNDIEIYDFLKKKDLLDKYLEEGKISPETKKDLLDAANQETAILMESMKQKLNSDNENGKELE